MNRKSRKTEFRVSGHTVLEVVLVLALMGMMASLLLGVYSSSVKSFAALDTSSQIQESARIGIDMIADDIRKCSTVASAGTGGLILISTDNSRIRYYAAGNVLYRSIDGVSNPVALDVLDFSVEETLPCLYRLRLVTRQGKQSYILETQVRRTL